MKFKPIKNISIALKPTKLEESSSEISNLLRWLQRRNINIYITINDYERLAKLVSLKNIKNLKSVTLEELFTLPELIISLGGDGTLIGSLRKLKKNIPIFGINLGHLGFITEFSKDDYYDELEKVLKGKYTLVKKHLYRASVTNNKNKTSHYYFFNDAVFTKDGIARLFNLSLEIDNENVYVLSGDGLIISTTVGSTAYSMAAGGPIVHPEVKALILTPICPHSLTHRPMVVPEHLDIKIQLLKRSEGVSLTLDGQQEIKIHKSDSVTISRTGRKSVSLIKNPHRTYFNTLKEKFIHGRR